MNVDGEQLRPRGSESPATLSRAAAELASRIGGDRWRTWLKQGSWFRPRLVDFRDSASVCSRDLRTVISAAEPSLESQWDGLSAEYGRIAQEIQSRSGTARLPFPSEWAVAPETGLLLYALIRGSRPETVLETGVANGVSSSVILEALERNGTGRLVSFDTSASAGALVPERLRARWNLQVLAPREARESFRQAVSRIPGVDLAFLDADHSYAGQMWEYTHVWPKLSANAWFLSDDVDWSYAFLDFCSGQGAAPWIHVCDSKVTGLVRASTERR